MSESPQERPVETSEGNSNPQKKGWLDILDVLSKLLLTILGLSSQRHITRNRTKIGPLKKLSR